MKKLTLVILVLLFTQCVQPQEGSIQNNQKQDTKLPANTEDTIITETENQSIEDRTQILKRLSNKIDNNKPLIVHVFVPLCDNENQGIVPTTESLGNGMSLKSNLYWATSKGVKRYFKELPNWKLIKNEFDIDSNVLERVVFKKEYKNKAKVFIITDAYRGNRMNACLADYFNSLSGNRIDSIFIEGQKYEVATNSDLIIFNGHNGLMDQQPDILPLKNHFPKDAVAIACISGKYFKGYYEYTNSYPLVNTNHLLYPGAFIIEEIINKWAELGSAQECKIAAGKSYYKHKPKSGPKGSQNLFNYGWDF